MRNLSNSLIAALWCGLVATPAAMLVFSADVLLAAGCAAGCGALLGGPILQPARIPSAGKAALRGLVITFCAYWLCLGLRSIQTANFGWLAIGLLGLIYVTSFASFRLFRSDFCVNDAKSVPDAG